MAGDPLIDALFPAEAGGDIPTSRGDPLVDALFGVESRVPQPEEKARPEAGVGSEFITGIGAGLKSLGGQFTAAAGVVSQLVGAEETAQGLFESAAETEAEIQAETPRAVGFEQAFDSPGNFVTWLSRMTGEQIPVLGTILLGGGLGGIVGGLIGRGVLTAAEAGSVLARAGGLAQKFGVAAGGIGAAAGFETGATAGEQFQAVGEVQPGVSLAAGVAKGALEVIVPFGLAKVLGISSAAAGGVLARITESLTKIQSRTGRALVTGAVAAPVEGATELMQEAIDLGVRSYVDENFQALGPEGVQRLLEASTTGLFMGVIFGGAAGGLSKRPVDDLEVDDFDPGSATGRVKPQGEVKEAKVEEAVREPLKSKFEGEAVPEPARAEPTVAVSLDGAAVEVEREQPPSSETFQEASVIISLGLNKIEAGDLATVVNAYNRSLAEAEVVVPPTDTTAYWQGLDAWISEKILEEGKGLTSLDNSLRSIGRELKSLYGKEDIQQPRPVIPHELTSTGKVTVDEVLSLDHSIMGDTSPVLTVDGNFRDTSGDHEAFASEVSDGTAAIRDIQKSHGVIRASGVFVNTGGEVSAGFEIVKDQPVTKAQLDTVRKIQKNVNILYIDISDGEGLRYTFKIRGKSFEILKLADVKGKFKVPKTFNELLAMVKKDSEEIEDNIQQLRKDISTRGETSTEGIFESVYKASLAESVKDNAQVLENMGLNPDSISHTPEGTKVDRVLKRMKVPRGKRRKLRALTDRYGKIREWGINVIQLAKDNPHIQGLVRYVELMDRMWSEKMGIVADTDEILRKWMASMSVGMQDRFAKFLFDMDGMEYLTEEEVEAGVSRFPTDEEFGALVRKHKLSREAVEMYRLVRDSTGDILNRVEAADLDRAGKTFSDPAMLAQETNRIKASMNRLRERPYFPHSRFGDYALIVHNLTADGEIDTVAYFEQFEDKAAAQAQVEAVREEFPEEGEFTDVGLRLIPDDVKSFKGMPPQLLEQMKAELSKSDMLTDEMRDWLDLFAGEFLPGKSFRKRLLRRKNVPGFSVDALRSYASYMRSAAGHVSRIKFNGDMDQTIFDMKAEMRALTPGTDVTKRSGIISFVERHKEEVLNPKADFAELRSVAFIWYLGFVPASAALNFTQVPMVAYPFLASRFPSAFDTKTINALKNGILRIHNTYRNKTKDVSDFKVWALDRAMSQNVINESLATELAAVADGNNMAKLIPGSPMQRFIAQTAHWSAFLFHHSEMINRGIVFDAGVELALANPDTKYLTELREAKSLEFEEVVKEGKTPSEAMAYIAGKDAVEGSQFQYSLWARPRFMRGKKAVIFTFFMFQQNMLRFALRDPGAARYWLMMLFAAGVMGLPGAEDLAAVAKWMARKFDKDFDVERELREFSLALLDDKVAPDMMLHGLSRIGFGIPQAMELIGLPRPSFDFSANLSMGQLVPGLQELTSVGGDFESRFSRATTDMAGATIGIGINAIKALTDDALPAGDWKRWERAMPRALRNMSKANRFLTEGRERNRADATVVEFDASDSNHVAEIFAQLTGFTPLRLSRRWDRDRMVKEAEMYWSTRRNTLMKQLDHARVLDDRALEKSIKGKIRQYNHEIPFGSMRISHANLRASAKARARSRRLQEAGIPSVKGLRPLARGISALFPEVEEDVEEIRVR
ncbi:hypothetical protein LCGC14_0389490 [marine sediment metagenome]|uniref:Uncharacterized protein n=1 Tax=marine sediment metagenome TaxID=412755 RepID=A0A0F9THY8_9ZZZZ